MEPRAQADSDGDKGGNQGQGSALRGRRALVVGGSGGIGAAISVALASRGASLLIHGRTSRKVAELVGTIRLSGGDAEGLVLDVESPEPLIAALEACGHFDVLVFAFGPFVRKSFADHTVSDWEKVALLDLALPGMLASRYFRAMCDRGFGRILFFGGTRTDTIRGFTSNAAYAAAKTSLGVLAKSIAIEGAPHNVAAVTVCPGIVRTEYIGPEETVSLSRIAPGGRLSNPGEVAAAALDLIDRDPCIASGAIVSLDSGFSPRY